MRRHRSILQAKEQDKNPQDQINEKEVGKLPKKEFRVTIVKMIQIVGHRREKIQETFNKDLELRSKQTVMNNTITEIKNTLEGINSRITEAEEWIKEMEDKVVEITAEEQSKEKKNERKTSSETSRTTLNAPTFEL